MRFEHVKNFLMLIFIGFLQQAILYSQTPSYYHYTSSDGLASSTVFDIIQDKEGFIWFGTLNGLSKFDGKHFTTYNERNGLNSSVITALLAGDDGDIYIGNYEKGINILRNGRIENFRSRIKGKNFNTTYLSRYDGKIYAYTRYGSIFIFHEKSNSSQDDFIVVPSSIYLLRLAKLSNGNLVALSSRGVFSIKNNKLVKMNINGLPDTEFYCLAERSDGSYFIGAKGAVYQIKNNSVIDKFVIDSYSNKLFYTIFCDSKNNIWFSVLGKGFFLISDGSGTIIDMGGKIGLENTQIDSFLEDGEGNIWISTFGKGVFCLNNLYLRNFSEKDALTNNNVNCIEKDKSGKILIGTINGISILEDGAISQLKDNSGKILSGYINDIKCFDDYVYVCWAPETPAIKNISYNGLKFRFTMNPSFIKTVNNEYVYGSSGNSLTITKEYKSNLKGIPRSPIFGDSLYQNRTNVVAEDSKNNIWIGTSLGLCKLSDIKIGPQNNATFKKTFFPNDPVLSSKINSIYCDNKNRVWFTGVKGIANYNLGNDSVSSYSSIMGHELSTPTSVAMDNKSRIWIGTMKGLYLLEGKTMKSLNSSTGLPSDEVLSLCFDEEKNVLYVGTSNGMSELDINLFDNYRISSPKIFVNKVISGDSTYTDYSYLEFDRDKNNVSVDISAINYSSPGSLIYKYKLNEEWYETNNNVLNFSSLQYGTYNLQIMARTQNSGWSNPYYLSFVIKPGFTETVWFKAGFFLLLFSITLLVVLWRMKQKTKRISEQLDLNERINSLKHEALSAMMNPHFIFNALNSVQYLINSSRNEEANDYIAMMAKLIRKNLDSAGSGFILLSEEINRLKLYLDLEKLRFQERFSYEIITGIDVDADSILIPNMIIQPFVENSLWHGIIISGIKGLITISFTFEDVDVDAAVCRSLIIKITDNGIGIEKGRQNKKEDHISKGIQIIEDRLKLLSTKMELPQPIMFEDLSSRNKNSHGTEVIISLPPSLYKNYIPESDTLSSLTE